jgi:hypothetical protein
VLKQHEGSQPVIFEVHTLHGVRMLRSRTRKVELSRDLERAVGAIVGNAGVRQVKPLPRQRVEPGIAAMPEWPPVPDFNPFDSDDHLIAVAD